MRPIRILAVMAIWSVRTLRVFPGSRVDLHPHTPGVKLSNCSESRLRLPIHRRITIPNLLRDRYLRVIPPRPGKFRRA